MIDVTLKDVEQARQRIDGLVRRTPMTSSEAVSHRLGTRVSLKLELFQKTGSFKVRGAFNKVLSSDREHCKQGLVAVSGGNHAQAVAYVASKLGLHATVIMPEDTPANYVDGTRGYGAEVVFAKNAAAAFEEVAIYEARGCLAIHPFDDPLVIAGQGTVGLEILEDVPDLTDLVVSIGGGGFIGGVAAAVKALRPEVKIWGVETAGADAMARALAAGEPVRLPAITSIARTLGAPSVTTRTLEMAQRYLESVTVVTDGEAIDSLRFLLERAKVLTEPAAACTLAAAQRLQKCITAGGHTVLVLCGGNIGPGDLCGHLARFHASK